MKKEVMRYKFHSIDYIVHKTFVRIRLAQGDTGLRYVVSMSPRFYISTVSSSQRRRLEEDGVNYHKTLQPANIPRVFDILHEMKAFSK